MLEITNYQEMDDMIHIKNIGWRKVRFDGNQTYVIIHGRKVLMRAIKNNIGY